MVIYFIDLFYIFSIIMKVKLMRLLNPLLHRFYDEA